MTADIFPLLLREISKGRVDVVIGSRFLGEGEYRAGWIRQIGIYLFRFIASWLCGQKITDPTSGYQALSRRAVEFCARDSFPGDYPDADVLVHDAPGRPAHPGSSCLYEP